MKIAYFYIKGFRRIFESTIECGDATFLIGENNIGKSTVLTALEYFLSDTKTLPEQDFFRIEESGYTVDEIVFEAKFSDLPVESLSWRGFKGRVFNEVIGKDNANCIFYRKTFIRGGNCKREMRTCKKVMQEKFVKCKSFEDFIQAGISETDIKECFGDDIKYSASVPTKDKDKLELLSEIWDVDEQTNEWAVNPGGIEGNIIVKLPRFLLIPAENGKAEIQPKGALHKTMEELFNEVREVSENYKQAQHFLNLLARELDPNDESKEFGRMLLDINQIISSVFIDSQIHITTNLSDPDNTIKPSFDIQMSSNVKTAPDRQGMGALRSTVFALLRYREQFATRKKIEGEYIRPLIIGFEEPEMYLHPNAASLMRDKLYELAISSNSKIICTTHSPYMIDLSIKIDKKNYPTQVLNLLTLKPNIELNTSVTNVLPFNTTKAYESLHVNDKNYVKFVLKIDDSIAKVFFCRRVIVVEGDTEELLLKETVHRLPTEIKKRFLSDYQIVKARGKAAIISLVKYLKVLGIRPFVIHDKDNEAGATKFNEPILASLDNNEKQRLVADLTIESLLEYEEPNNEKPYRAYKFIQENWGDEWDTVKVKWRTIFENQIVPEIFVKDNVKNVVYVEERRS